MFPLGIKSKRTQKKPQIIQTIKILIYKLFHHIVYLNEKLLERIPFNKNVSYCFLTGIKSRRTKKNSSLKLLTQRPQRLPREQQPRQRQRPRM